MSKISKHRNYCKESQSGVSMIARKKGSRRFDMPVEFPLEDSRGVIVIQDRRRLLDRRKDIYGIDDLKVILTKMARNQTE